METNSPLYKAQNRSAQRITEHYQMCRFICSSPSSLDFCPPFWNHKQVGTDYSAVFNYC